MFLLKLPFFCGRVAAGRGAAQQHALTARCSWTRRLHGERLPCLHCSRNEQQGPALRCTDLGCVHCSQLLLELLGDCMPLQLECLRQHAVVRCPAR